MSNTPSLESCPFCAGGETHIHVNKGTWNGRGYGEPVSVEVRHWCESEQGQPSRMISRAGRDEASAIAAWNRRTPPVVREPVAYRHMHDDGWEYYDAPTGSDCPGCEPLYTTPQPTQAQAGAVPLTLEAINAMAREYPAEDLCGWSYRMGIADAEQHYGIKGGQHGTDT